MAKRIDQNELDVDIKELSSYAVKNIIASVEDNRTEAEIEALKLRLQGKPAFVQNGLQGKYEVLASERQPELRELNASFTEVGAGVYKAGNPAWDKGSLWTIYTMNEDGSILLSRMEDEEEESREALTANLMVKSNIRGRNAAASYLHKVGEVIEFVDSEGRFSTGQIVEVDQRARHYVVLGDQSFEREWVPFSLTASDSAFTSDDAGADDDFEFSPESHSEQAYTSDDAGADDDYTQNENDIEGFESMEEFDESTEAGEDLNKELQAEFGDDEDEDMDREADFDENGLDDIQTLDHMGDSMYDDVEDETSQVGDVVEAGFDTDMNFDDMYQTPEDLQPAVDHYDFDQELYALASASEDSGDDDMEQPIEEFQSQEGEEDVNYDDVEDEINQVGDVVDTPELNYNELHQVQRDQLAKYKRPEKDIWLI